MKIENVSHYLFVFSDDKKRENKDNVHKDKALFFQKINN